MKLMTVTVLGGLAYQAWLFQAFYAPLGHLMAKALTLGL